MTKSDKPSAVTDNFRSRELRSLRTIPAMWIGVMTIYLALLASTSCLAFWDQDFNDLEETVELYGRTVRKHGGGKDAHDIERGVDASTSEIGEGSHDALITEVIRRNADAAGDLQDLASQSFNIVLGALLAFLSASATTVFREFQSGAPHNDDS